MRKAILVMSLVLAMSACNRSPAPAAAPADEGSKAAPTTPANPAVNAPPVAPVAEDTSDDSASFQARTKIPAMVTVLNTAAALKEGARVNARFGSDRQIPCTVGVAAPIKPGQGSEVSLICEGALDLANGAFDFTLHQAGKHVADGVVLR